MQTFPAVEYLHIVADNLLHAFYYNIVLLHFLPIRSAYTYGLLLPQSPKDNKTVPGTPCTGISGILYTKGTTAARGSVRRGLSPRRDRRWRRWYSAQWRGSPGRRWPGQQRYPNLENTASPIPRRLGQNIKIGKNSVRNCNRSRVYQMIC